MGLFSSSKSNKSSGKNQKTDSQGNTYTKTEKGSWKKDRPVGTNEALDEASRRGDDTGI